MRIFSTLQRSVILLAILCASCGTALPTIKPYKLEVQQGNVVTSKMLLQLRPGMTQSQVRFIMGTPLIQDSFHGNRWDYIYQMREQGKITEQRRVILDFEGEALKTVRGDVIPKGSELNKENEDTPNLGARVINPVGKPKEKSMFSKLKFWQNDEADLAKEAEVAKAKAETDEAAKNATEKAKEDLNTQNATPAESQSILAVPLELIPMVDTAAPVTEVEEPVLVKTQDAAKKEVVKPDVEPTTKAVVEPVEAKKEPISAQPSKLNSSMGFDRKLHPVVESQQKAASEAPVSGTVTKSIPKPNDLPAEGEPSFFDRMLEKIGF
jgi:outer membrane protein assembly factor BamE